MKGASKCPVCDIFLPVVLLWVVLCVLLTRLQRLESLLNGQLSVKPQTINL